MSFMLFAFTVANYYYHTIPSSFTQLKPSIMEVFSIILIKNRQRLNLSQEEVAIKLGTNQSTYQEWEKVALLN